MRSGTRASKIKATKEFDTSGKSPVHIQHRRNSRARAGKLAAGFFESGNFLNRAGLCDSAPWCRRNFGVPCAELGSRKPR
jgi:hypothetical protein